MVKHLKTDLQKFYIGLKWNYTLLFFTLLSDIWGIKVHLGQIFQIRSTTINAKNSLFFFLNDGEILPQFHAYRGLGFKEENKYGRI